MHQIRRFGDLLASAVWGLSSLSYSTWCSGASDHESALYFLPEIVVLAEAPTTPVRGTDKWVVDQTDLAAFNAITVADALRYQPGVNIQYGASSAEARVWIRGFRDRDVLVLYDGVPMASAYDGTIDLNELTSGPVQRIQVSKAAPSVIYGANGVGGVVDVIPLSPEGTPTLLRAEIAQGQTRVVRGDTSFTSSLGSVLMSAGHSTSDGYLMPSRYPTQPYQMGSSRNNADFTRDDILIRAVSNRVSIGETALTYMRVSASKGLPPGLGPDAPKFERLNRSDRQSFIFSQRVGDRAALKGYYNRYDFELASYTDGSYGTVDEVDKGSDNAFGIRAYGRFALAGLDEVMLAASYGREQFSADNTFLNSTSESVDTYTFASEYSRASDRSPLAWRAGFIATHFQGGNGTRVRAFNPQIAAEYQLSPMTTISGSYAQRTRLPKLGELYERRFGNPLLRELESNNAELTVTTSLDSGHRLSASIFHNDIDGLIEKPARQLPWENLDNTVIKGLELAGDFRVTSHLSLSVGGAWVDAEETTPAGVKRQIRSRPKRSGFLDARMELGEFDVGLRGEYVDQLHDVTKTGIYTELDRYVVLSAKVSWRVSDALTVYANCANIEDIYYEQKLGFVREGRQLSLGAILQINSR